MGIYAVTGGSSGIGEKTVDILRGHGHTVLNIDRNGGDINVDLGTKEGRPKQSGSFTNAVRRGLTVWSPMRESRAWIVFSPPMFLRSIISARSR
jgi:NAD(P)-dependent dehydrogenase (short-subunit alcohol dehydrogenase family)